MQTTFICFSHNLNYALGWMVVHSLWQATAIAFLSGVLSIVMRNKAAKMRYLVSNTALFTVLAAAVVTFCVYYDFSKEAGQIVFIPDTESVVNQQLTAVGANSPMVQSPNIAEEAPLSMAGLKAYFNRHIYLIVTIWALGVALFMLRLLGGISYVYYLKSRLNFPADEYWQELLDGLKNRVGVQKGIELLESALVRSPIVIGHLKPVILFPIGAINRLNPNEVEAILAHELAHVLRNDYAFNIIQSVIEALFYFHPAVWWISAQIRTERENCCDDVAIELCGNSMTYAKSLVSVQEMAYYSPQMAMAFAGKSNKNQLLMRVQRVLNQPQNKTNVREKLIATCLLVALMFSLSFGGTRLDRQNNGLLDTNTNDLIENTDENTSENTPDTEGSNFLIFVNKNGQLDSFPIMGEIKDGKYAFSDNTQTVDLTVKDKQVVQFNINGLEVASADIPKFGKMINRIITPASPPSPPSPDAPPSPEGMYLQSNGNQLSMNENGLHLNGVDDKGNPIKLSVDANGFVMNGDGVSINFPANETTYEEDAKPVKGIVDYHKNGKLSSVVGIDGTIQNYDEKGDLVNIIKPNGVNKDYKNRKLVSKYNIYNQNYPSRSSNEDNYEEDAKPIDGKKSYHTNGQVNAIVGTGGAIQRFNDKGELEVVIKQNGTVKRYKNKKLVTVTNNGSNNYPQSSTISRKTKDPYNTLHLKADNGFTYVSFTLNGNNIWKCYKNEALLGDLTLSNNKPYYDGHIATAEELKRLGLLWYNNSLNPLTGGFQIINNNINGNINTNRHYDEDDVIEERIDALKHMTKDMQQMLSGSKCRTLDVQWFNWANARLAAQNGLINANSSKEGLDNVENELNAIQKQFDKIKASKKDPDCKECKQCHEEQGFIYSYGTTEQARKNAERMSEQARKDAETARKDAETAKRDAQTAKRDAETARRDAEKQSKGYNYNYGGNSDNTNQAKTDLFQKLVKDGYISLNKKCRVSFNNDELTVDGKDIDDAVFQRYKADFERKMGKKTNYSIDFKGIVTAVKGDGINMTGNFHIDIGD